MPYKTSQPLPFALVEPVWATVGKIKAYLDEMLTPGVHGEVMPGAFVGSRVFIGKGTKVMPGAVILGPAWIGDGCFVAPGCYIRENVIIDHGSIVANSSEFKNCVLFEDCEVPHFNYVGDSLLGHKDVGPIEQFAAASYACYTWGSAPAAAGEIG